MNMADFLLGLVTGLVIAFGIEAYRAWREGKDD
jgi:hypothetical protein